ncbi:hypothetical protein JCM8097_008787 [Rhodosporidiobolus ruineniae]
MPAPPSKRRRSPSRSPSPQLPLHLLTSLPSFKNNRTSTSTVSNSTSFLPPTSSSATQDDRPQLRLPPHLAHGLVAHEATLLSTASSAAGEGHAELASELEDVERARGGGRTRMVRWAGSAEGGEEVWTDRYDLLHLLPSLPSHLSFPHPAPTPSLSTSDPPPAARSPSPGFSDLPSDHEELFFFSPAERLEVERKKKRRRVEEERERRVKAVEERERQEALERGEALADDDEGDELSPAQLALMHKLHATLSTSPNPSLLELRILANHGSDPKFAFLRAVRPGVRESERERRAREVWGRIRRGEKVDERGELVAEEKEEKKGGGALGGLAAYGSDSGDDSANDEPSPAPATAPPSAAPNAPAEPQPADPLEPSSSSAVPAAALPSIPSAAEAAEAEADEEADEEHQRRQREKQEKAREWARKRREKRVAKEAATAGEAA